jgi:hypothetical protein
MYTLPDTAIRCVVWSGSSSFGLLLAPPIKVLNKYRCVRPSFIGVADAAVVTHVVEVLRHPCEAA